MGMMLTCTWMFSCVDDGRDTNFSWMSGCGDDGRDTNLSLDAVRLLWMMLN